MTAPATPDDVAGHVTPADVAATLRVHVAAALRAVQREPADVVSDAVRRRGTRYRSQAATSSPHRRRNRPTRRQVNRRPSHVA
ncbi:MAG: hypothetical protein ACREQ5_01825 [Candidatus Dormibacteria bacterium]